MDRITRIPGVTEMLEGRQLSGKIGRRFATIVRPNTGWR